MTPISVSSSCSFCRRLRQFASPPGDVGSGPSGFFLPGAGAGGSGGSPATASNCSVYASCCGCGRRAGPRRGRPGAAGGVENVPLAIGPGGTSMSASGVPLRPSRRADSGPPEGGGVGSCWDGCGGGVGSCCDGWGAGGGRRRTGGTAARVSSAAGGGVGSCCDGWGVGGGGGCRRGARGGTGSCADSCGLAYCPDSCGGRAGGFANWPDSWGGRENWPDCCG